MKANLNSNYRNNSGFTLIELMVTLAVLAIIVTIAIPSMQTIIQNGRIRSESEDLFALISQAKNLAITEGRNGVVCRATTDFGSCLAEDNNDWSTEKVVFSINNGSLDATFTAQQIVRTADANTLTVIMSTNDNAISFRSDSTIVNAAPLIISICDSRGEGFGKFIRINAVGRMEFRDTGAAAGEVDCSATVN